MIEKNYGMTHEILKFTEGHISIPVTVDAADIERDPETGKRIVPAGTFVGGGIKENRNALAQKVIVGGRKALLYTPFGYRNSNLVFVARKGGVEGNAIKVEMTANTASQALGVTVSGKTVTVALKTDASKVVQSTANEVIEAIAQEVAADALIEAKTAYQSDGTGTVGTLALTSLSGGENSIAAEGILRYDIDVTHGPMPGAAVVKGCVDLNKLPAEPTDKIKEQLKGNIEFFR